MKATPVRQAAALGLAALGLAGCAAPAGDAAPAPPAAVPAPGAAPAAGGAPAPPPEPDAQQALIDAVNRDGRPLDYAGWRDPAPSPAAPPAEDVVELNYEQASLRLVLEELAGALDLSLVIDPAIDGQVTMRTSPERPLRMEDVWPLMRLLARDAGVVLERAGAVYNARRAGSALAPEIATPETLGGGAAARIMQVTPLTYVSAEAVEQAIGPLLEPDGGVARIGVGNLLLITAPEETLVRVNQLLLLLDADPFRHQGIRVYRLGNAGAAEVAEELREILALIEGPDPAFQVRGIERINAVLVTAPAARGFEEVSRWVRILDAASQEQVERLFMYRVKNLAARDLAATLSDVFGDGGGDEDAPPAAAAVPGVPDPAAAPAPDRPPAGPAEAGGAAADLSVRVVADEATNSLLVRASARDYRQLLTTISRLDVVPLQVMVNAVIAQVTLTDDTRFGVDWSRVAADAGASPISTATVTDFTPELGGLMFSKGFLDGAARVEATLEAIASDNDVRLLARPSLTVSNNQEGEIQIGAEVPVEAGQTIGAGGVSTTNIQYRPTGIELYITPQINEDGVVSLIIRQVLSSVDSGAAGVNNNPVFTNQEISTTVVVRDGENVVLGGLIQSDDERLATGVPLLGRLPLLGGLFSYRRDRAERRELFIVLRPEIINLNRQAGVQYSAILDRFELASELLDRSGVQ